MTASNSERKRILSGVQSSGKLHLGNYFGAIKQHIELQDQGECFYFIADYHALTTIHDREVLSRNVFDAALDYLALGLDPERVAFFRQSDVPEVTELAWILATVTGMGLLERAHSYKDKIEQGITPSVGLFTYPVLMAADILIYDADRVPVGQDQKQHLEVTRDVAMKFNDRFGPVFRIPEPVIREETATLPGTDGQKMSKSYGNIVEIFATEKEFRKKIMGIKTDSTPVESPKPVENSILLALAKTVASPSDYEAMVASMQAGGKGYGDYKKQLFEMLWEHFAPFRARRTEWEQDPARVEAVLQRGAEKARVTARAVLARARQAVGIQSR